MLRRPVSKNCRFCGRFMELFWVEIGTMIRPAIHNEYFWLGCDEGLLPVFYCGACNEWDDERIDVRHYAWLIYKGTIDFKEAKKELLISEYFALLSEQRWMKYLFLNRPYLAIPSD